MEQVRNDKAFFYVFPTLKVEDDIQILFADVEVRRSRRIRGVIFFMCISIADI